MSRSVLLFVTLCSVQTLPAFAQPVPLSPLGLGTIYTLKSVEADGRPGREFLVKTGSPLHDSFIVVYPHAPGGLCTSIPIQIAIHSDVIDDFDGDGDAEIMRFDFSTQTVRFLPFPPCRSLEPQLDR